jgi:FKBP-type peptidyl-prolyl cis-trans isomerase SlyD
LTSRHWYVNVRFFPVGPERYFLAFLFFQEIEENFMIKTGSKVSIHYKLSVEGNVVDSSEGRDPLTYVQGSDQIILGLEDHLEGMNAGDQTKVSIPAEKAYGTHDPEAVHDFPKDAFESPEKISVGMTVQGTSQQGQPFSAVVTKVSDDEVTLDLNHPLAGKTLEFEVSVVDVR